MGYLNILIESIITENVNIPKITDAIRKRKPVKITYEADEDPRGNGERIIHPVAYGISKAGNMVLRAFQPYGDTKTKVPHWKLFRVDKIKNFNILWKRQSFSEPPGQFGGEGEYNPNGDNSMSQVYLNANFQNAIDFSMGKKGQGLMRYNKQREQEKLAKDPLYKLKKNIQNAHKDKGVTTRVKSNPSMAARQYVTNDDFIEDMNKVNNTPEEQPQTIGAIEKGDATKQRSERFKTQPVHNLTKPITKDEPINNIPDNEDIDDIENN
jgi:hypothetical protein